MTEAKSKTVSQTSLTGELLDAVPAAPIVEWPDESDPDEPFKGIVIHKGELKRQNQKRGMKTHWKRKRDKTGDIDRRVRPSLANEMFKD
jgi:hypothetical protein